MNSQFEKLTILIKLLDFIPNVLSTAFIYWLFSWLFNKFIWKCSLIKKWHGIPNLNGEWTGSLNTSYHHSPIDMNMTIKQTWSEISFKSTFPTTQSKSYSNVAAIYMDDLRGLSIYFGFINESSCLETKLQRYYGYNILSLSQDSNIITAQYFNNRPNPNEWIKGGNMGTFTLTKTNDTTDKT